MLYFLIKNKLDKEKDKDEKYSPKNCKLRRLSKPPFPSNPSPEMVSKLDLADAKNSDTAHIKSIEITSILNGLQGKHNCCMQVFVFNFYKCLNFSEYNGTLL